MICVPIVFVRGVLIWNVTNVNQTHVKNQELNVMIMNRGENIQSYRELSIDDFPHCCGTCQHYTYQDEVEQCKNENYENHIVLEYICGSFEFTEVPVICFAGWCNQYKRSDRFKTV